MVPEDRDLTGDVELASRLLPKLAALLPDHPTPDHPTVGK